MKLLVVVVLVAIQGITLAQGQSIQDAIDDFVQTVKNLIPEPVDLPELDVDVPENDYLAGHANVTDGTLGGLRDFSVQMQYRGIIIPIPTGFTITISNLNFYSKLLTELKIYNPKLHYVGDVLYNTLTTDVIVQGGLDFTLIPLNFSVNSLDISVGGILFNIEGLISERFSLHLSQFLTDHVVNVVNRILDDVSPLLVDLINEIIGGIFSRMDINPDNAYGDGSQEKAAEQLRQFFEILKKSLRLYPS